MAFKSHLVLLTGEKIHGAAINAFNAVQVSAWNTLDVSNVIVRQVLGDLRFDDLLDLLVSVTDYDCFNGSEEPSFHGDEVRILAGEMPGEFNSSQCTFAGSISTDEENVRSTRLVCLELNSIRDVVVYSMLTLPAP